MAQVHFEIFRQQGKGTSWSLVEAFDERATAMTRAKELLASGQAAAVRVVKETLNAETGDYMSLTVLEEGEVNTKKKKKGDGDPQNPLPCFKPDDLYSYHARSTIGRLLGEWLTRQRLTVTELLHSAAALEKFEATGTTYQHAVQKIAVAEAADSEMPVQQIIKSLNDLCNNAIQRIYRDEKKNVFPTLTAEQFAGFVERLGDRADGSYLLGGALAKYLAPAKGWDAKLQLLLALMPLLPAQGPARGLMLSGIDTIVAELLNGAAALADLLGPSGNLGHALFNLTQLFLGQPVDTAEGTGTGINHLAAYFAKDDLPNGRAAIAGRILTELRSMKRLCPSDLEEELKTLRKLANQLVRGQGKYLSNEDLIGAFTDRSKRMVTQEPIAQFLQACKTADEKIERLLVIEENIIGVENKRTLAGFMIPLLQASSFEEQLAVGAPPLQRMKRTADLQQRVLRSGLQEPQRGQIAQGLDVVASRIEGRAGILASLENRIANPVERAQAILRLCTGGVLTQGELANKARRQLLATLAKPGFFASYLTQATKDKQGVDKAQVMSDLAAQLGRAGIDPQEGLRVLAA